MMRRGFLGGGRSRQAVLGASALLVGVPAALGIASGAGASTARSAAQPAGHGFGPGGAAFGGDSAQITGLVTATGTDTLTLTLTADDAAAMEPAGSSLTVTTDPSTTYGEHLPSGSPAPHFRHQPSDAAVVASDVVVGALVTVRPTSATASSSSPTAQRVDIIGPFIAGVVVSDTGSTIVLRDAEGFSRTVTVTGSTTYSEAGQSSTASAVAIGSEITAIGTVDANGTSLDASSVEIVLAHLVGKVVSVSGTTISVDVVSGRHGSSSSTAVAVATTASTSFIALGREGATAPSLTTLVAGQLVVVSGTWAGTSGFDAVIVAAAAPLSTSTAPPAVAGGGASGTTTQGQGASTTATQGLGASAPTTGPRHGPGPGHHGGNGRPGAKV